jgi:hypothetical protein
MAHTRTGTAKYKNLFVNGSRLNTYKGSSAPLTGMSVRSESQLPQIEDVRFEDLDITITDNGDASGGYNASVMFRLPSTRVILLGAFLDLTVNSIGTGLLDGSYTAAVGTAPATDSTHTGGQVDIIASGAITVSGGTGTIESVGAVLLTYLDATTAKDIHLNIGVPDASITATGTINVTGVFRLVYIDISDGE